MNSSKKTYFSEDDIKKYATLVGLEGIPFEIQEHFVKFQNGELFNNAKIRKVLKDTNIPTLHFPITNSWIKQQRPYSKTENIDKNFTKQIVTLESLESLSFHKKTRGTICERSGTTINRHLHDFFIKEMVCPDSFFFTKNDKKINSNKKYKTETFFGFCLLTDNTPWSFMIEKTDFYTYIELFQSLKIFDIKEELQTRTRNSLTGTKIVTKDGVDKKFFHKYSLTRAVFESEEVAFEFLEKVKKTCQLSI